MAIAKFCLSIKDCRSQASFNDFTMKGLGPKILAQGPKFLDCYEKPRFGFWFQNSKWFWRVIAQLCFISWYPLKGPGTDIIAMTTNFFQRSFAQCLVVSAVKVSNDSDKYLQRHSVIKDRFGIRCPSHDVTDLSILIDFIQDRAFFVPVFCRFTNLLT